MVLKRQLVALKGIHNSSNYIQSSWGSTGSTAAATIAIAMTLPSTSTRWLFTASSL